MSALRRQHHPADADLVLGALARRAATDDLAARTLLQAVLPGLRSLANAHYWLAPREELEASLVAVAWEHIRSYPITTRPRRIAANLLLDTGHHLRRAYPPHPAQAIADAGNSEGLGAAPGPGEELTELVFAAVARGALRPEPASLIIRTRVLDERVTDIAKRLGYPADTIRHRRRRAELALKASA
jgi:DNA-directed RNA polymerase specialized sigma24 family protein